MAKRRLSEKTVGRTAEIQGHMLGVPKEDIYLLEQAIRNKGETWSDALAPADIRSLYDDYYGSTGSRLDHKLRDHARAFYGLDPMAAPRDIIDTIVPAQAPAIQNLPPEIQQQVDYVTAAPAAAVEPKPVVIEVAPAKTETQVPASVADAHDNANAHPERQQFLGQKMAQVRNETIPKAQAVLADPTVRRNLKTAAIAIPGTIGAAALIHTLMNQGPQLSEEEAAYLAAKQQGLV